MERLSAPEKPSGILTSACRAWPRFTRSSEAISSISPQRYEAHECSMISVGVCSSLLRITSFKRVKLRSEIILSWDRIYGATSDHPSITMWLVIFSRSLRNLAISPETILAPIPMKKAKINTPITTAMTENTAISVPSGKKIELPGSVNRRKANQIGASMPLSLGSACPFWV